MEYKEQLPALFPSAKPPTLFPGGSDSKESARNVGDLGLVPGLGRSPGDGNSYPLQYSCLENTMDREASQTTVHGGHRVGDTTEQLKTRPTIFMWIY